MQTKFIARTLAVIVSLMLIVLLLPISAFAVDATALQPFTVLEIPIYKTVTADRGVNVPEAQFECEIVDTFANADITVTYNSVETHGTGEFEGVLKISIPTISAFYDISEGFVVKEKNTGLGGWTYDETEWYVEPYMDGATGEIFVGFYNKTAGEEIDYTDHMSHYAGVAFTNSYRQDGPMTPTGASGSDKIEIPYTKTVTAKEGTIAPQATFRLEIGGIEASVLDANFSVDGNVIRTSGVGTYINALTLTPEDPAAFSSIANGFTVTEKNGGDSAWDYDETTWFVTVYQSASGEYVCNIVKEDELNTPAAMTYESMEFTNYYKGGNDSGNDPAGNSTTGGTVVKGNTNEYTMRIPLVKTVVQGGDKKAPEKSFSIVFSDYKVSNSDFNINLASIDTNGKGVYSGALVITPVDEAALNKLMSGFKAFEDVPSNTGDWEYDKSVWLIVPSVDQDGTVSCRCYNETLGETPNNSTGSNTVEFTNTYTAFVTPTDDKDKDKDADKDVILTYDVNGGFAYDTVETYKKGTKVSLTKAASRDGFTFLGWFESKDSTDKLDNITLDGNKTVYAHWVQTVVPEMLDATEHNAYVIGYEDGTVRPANDITRAEVTMIFYRLLKASIREANETTVNNFSDVGGSDWFNKAVSTMAKIGIIKGRTATEFAPNAPITRAEYATICARFDNSVGFGTSDFTDISGHWAESYITRACVLGWVKGYEDKTFRPDREITRAEAMTLTNRVLQRIPDGIGDLMTGMRVFSDNSDATVWYYIPVQEATNSHGYEEKSNGHEKWTELKN